MQKLLLILFAGLLAGAGSFVVHTIRHMDVPPIVSGQYVEVRSASVFAGGCHINSEADHQGRRALMGFRLEEGRILDEDLAGVEIVVAIASDGNLADDLPRRSVVYIDESVTEFRRLEAICWLTSVFGARLGTIEEVVSAPVSVHLDGSDFRLDVPGVVSVEGSTLPDLECCTMPESVWYAPLAPSARAVVGNATRCRFEGAGSIAAWTYEDRNNAFLGAFSDWPPLGGAAEAGAGLEGANSLAVEQPSRREVPPESAEPGS